MATKPVSRAGTRSGPRRPTTVGNNFRQRPSTVGGEPIHTTPVEEIVESQASIEKDRNLSMWDAAPWREKLYAVAEPGSFPSDVPYAVEVASYLYALCMVSIICVSCVSIMEESMPRYQMQPLPLFWIGVEAICVAIFTLDIIVRFVTIPQKIDFVKDGMNYIDVVSVIPFYVELVSSFSLLSWLRMLRILRLVRIIRVLRHANVLGFVAILDATSQSLTEMTLFILISGTCLLILATAFFFVERGSFDPAPPAGNGTGLWMRRCFKYEACPNGVEPSPVQSIPDAFWYTITTLSTVGFGDVYPKTGSGQLVGALTMIVGVFIMGFPTMILSGHYEAVEKLEIKMFNDWAHFLSLRAKTESPSDTLKRKMGWARRDVDTPATKKDSTTPNDETKSLDALDTPRGGKGAASMSSLRSGSTTQRRITPRSRPFGETIGFFNFGGRTNEVQRSTNSPHMYFYDPMFMIQRTMEGTPELRVIWGKCGMPTMVQLTIILDHADARHEAVRIVNSVDPHGSIRCNVGGGFVVKHYTPSGRPTKYKMAPAEARDNFRNSDFPIYFMRDEDNDGEADDVDYLDEDLVVEETLASLLGTSLFIEFKLPEPIRRRRVTIVQQMLQETRLQRELELIAVLSDDGLEQMAYITNSDAKLLLAGVSSKIDLQDPSLALESPERVDGAMADAVLARLRTVKLHNVPQRHRTAVYNGDLIRPKDSLYEVPMSLFHADELDEVEVDSLGYVEVRVSPFLARTVRVDIRMDGSTVVNPGSLNMSDW